MFTVLGIDVSKSTLDVCLAPQGQQAGFPNSPAGFPRLLEFLQKHRVHAVCCEATGCYSRNLVQFLHQHQIPVTVANPAHIRYFAKACGQLAKTDRVDARIIARFAEKVQPAYTAEIPEIEQEIADLNTRRTQLVDQITQEKNRLEACRFPYARKSLQKHLDFLEQERQAVELEIQKLIHSSAPLQEKSRLLTSCQGIGPQTAAVLLAELPELGQLSREAVAKLVGVAPLNRDSGLFRGKRMTGGGRKHLRTRLYMPVLVAIKHNPPLKQFYQRLVQTGKPKMVALIAVMRKLLITLNAMLKQGVPWKNTCLSN